MKIGVLGSGSVGGSLGTRWAKNGHQVVFSTRDPDSEKMNKLLANAGSNARAASAQETVSASDVLLLATPWPATEQVVRSAGDLHNKILIDATNPLQPDLSGSALPPSTSAGEEVSKWAKGARVVKAFNTVGNNVMENSDFPGGPVVLFYCGDDGEAKKAVLPLISELGFDAQDAGPLDMARVLEGFALLWISLAFKGGYGREIAFSLLRRG